MKSILILMALTAAAFADTDGKWTGTITDSMCVKSHAAMNIPGDDNCVRECVKSSPQYKYVLYDGQKTYKLSDQKMPELYAAKRVVVKGKLYDKTGVIKVESISPAN